MQLILAVPKKKKTAHATHLYNNYFLHLYYHIQFSVFEGRPRSKQTIEATAGAVTGEATFEGDNADNYYHSNGGGNGDSVGGDDVFGGEDDDSNDDGDDDLLGRNWVCQGIVNFTSQKPNYHFCHLPPPPPPSLPL